MLKRKLLTIFLLIILFSSICFAQRISEQEILRKPVVVVETTQEMGAGFLAGYKENRLYFFTAYHVIESAPDTIYVRFRSGDIQQAAVFNSSQDADIAVLTCPIPVSFEIPSSFMPSDLSPTFKQNILIIGHPYGEEWDINFSNRVKDINMVFKPYNFTITPNFIRPGISGGPVLNEQQHLIGMDI